MKEMKISSQLIIILLTFSIALAGLADARAQCTDSDAGKGSDGIKGITTGYDLNYRFVSNEDYCFSQNTLMEFYCGSVNQPLVKSMAIECKYGCFGGACKPMTVPDGKLVVQVNDAGNKPVARATVDVMTPTGGIIIEGMTTAEGHISFTLRPGRYVLKANSNLVFGNAVYKNAEILPGKQSDVTMVLGGMPKQPVKIAISH